MPTVPQVSRLCLKNILFPTDLSDDSRAALPFARALADIYGSTIQFAYCIPPEPRQMVVTDVVPAQDNLVWQNARDRITKFAAQCFLPTAYKTLVDRGDLSDVIPAIISEHGIDMVVLATHGRRGMSKIIFGSAAEQIYRSAPCPVLAVGPKVRNSKDWRLRRILCPVDVSEDPEPVLHYAVSLAEENQCEFIVLQAIPLVPWQHRESMAKHARLALESLIPEQAKNWCVPQVAIRWEHPVEAIVREAQERESDLIVMSVHKARAVPWSSHLPWPVASEVVGGAPCPVLTVRV